MKDSRTVPLKPRTLIEDWLPIETIGCESMRERGASSALPPLYFLHVWWARRPLLASRAALLASVLPSWSHLAPGLESGVTDRSSDDEPTTNADRGLAADRNDRMRIHEGRERGPETSAEPPPRVVGQTAAHGQPGGAAGQRASDLDRESGTILERERELPFRSAEEYEQWFIRLCGIFGDPVAGRKKIRWAKQQGIRLKDPPYTHKRAFTVNPTGDQLQILEDLLQHAWGKGRLSVLDPFAGGGSIPFEAVRYGFDTSAKELNPVAGAILRGTLQYPFVYGSTLAADIRRWGKRLTSQLGDALSPYYPKEPAGSVHAYIWARTVACPYTGKPVPLAPNWWLARSGASGKAILPSFEENSARARFRVVEIKDGTGPDGFDPAHGTVRRGRGRSPWANDQAIEGDHIKAEAQAGRMGSQLYCVAVKKPRGGFEYRPPNDEDMEAVEKAEAALARKRPLWEARGWVPSEAIPPGLKSDEPRRYGMYAWSDMFSPRQLLALCSYVEDLHDLVPEIKRDLPKDRAKAVVTYLGMVLSKAVNYNAYLASWHPTRRKIRGVFDRHDFSFKWTYGEFDASRNLFPWGLDQVCDAYKGLAKLAEPAHRIFKQTEAPVPVRVTRASASDLSHVPDGSIDVVLTDPPYYDNVMYGELSDFFYVWLKRTLGSVHPDLFADDLANKDDEAVANPARFAAMGRKRKQLAAADYERKMAASFREARRVLTDDGVLTVMFTHKKVEAWDTLAMSLLEAGFAIQSSWPVHTESEHGLHQAKKNAALSTILLTCRKRPQASEPAWWDDIRGRVRRTARETAEELQDQGISGVDLYIATFGPTLAILSESWPVLTSEVDEKTGEPKRLRPDVALDLARSEVVELRKRGLLGRDTRFDPVTDWYLMAWDAFKAVEFPGDEARKLALALGLDLERDLVARNRILRKKGASVVLLAPSVRRGRGRVDPDSEAFSHWIDAAHTAMMLYSDEGANAAEDFLRRAGFHRDATFESLLQALVRAVPRVKKKGVLVRPEARALDGLRLAFFPDVEAPPDPEAEVSQGALKL